jgi:hypothetical protein
MSFPVACLTAKKNADTQTLSPHKAKSARIYKIYHMNLNAATKGSSVFRPDRPPGRQVVTLKSSAAQKKQKGSLPGMALSKLLPGGRSSEEVRNQNKTSAASGSS